MGKNLSIHKVSILGMIENFSRPEKKRQVQIHQKLAVYAGSI
jgi:hypothetical protein